MCDAKQSPHNDYSMMIIALKLLLSCIVIILVPCTSKAEGIDIIKTFFYYGRKIIIHNANHLSNIGLLPPADESVI